MVEEIGKIISNSIDTYTNNLNMIIPFIINFIIIIFGIVLFSIGIIFILRSSISSLEEPSSPEQFVMIFIQLISQHIMDILILVIISVLIFTFVNSFFIGGAIGMARQATETGKSRLSTMMESGRKNLVNLFLTQILIGLLFIAGIVFLVPGALKTDIDQLLTQETFDENLLLAVGFLLLRIYGIILNLIMALSKYALVIDNLEPIDSIMTSFRFFMKHKTDVFIVWLIWFVILEISLQIWALNPNMGMFVIGLIFIFILEPLFMVMWVRLYMTRTGKHVYVNDLLAHPNDLPKP